MKMLFRAALALLALLCAPAMAQNPTTGSLSGQNLFGYGVDLAHPLPVYFGNAQFPVPCTVLAAGDAGWTPGQPYLLPCTSTGRLRVGLSSAVQVGGALASYSDLAGYQAADGTQKPGSLDAGGNVRTADGGNASYSTVPDQSSAASYTFSAANVATARRWWANCPSNTTITVTLTLAGGGTRPVTLFDGPSGDSERISGFSGNTGANGACTIGIEG